MRRPSTIRLALMGGGAVLVLGGGALLLSRPSAACRDARAAGLETAEELCRSSSGSYSGGSGSSHWSSFYGGTSGTSSSSRGGSASSVSTGGFGGSAHAAGS